MSIKLMSEIWDNEDKELVGSKLIVLLCLADHANDDGVCWPSIGRLAKRARIDRRNVTNHVNDLEAMGYITVEHRPGNRNIYNVSPKRTHDASIIPTHDATVIPTHDASIIGGMMPASYKPSVNHQLEPSVEPSVTPVSQAQPPCWSVVIDQQLLNELTALNGNAPTHSAGTEKEKRKPRSKVTPVSPGVMSSDDVAPVPGSSHNEMFAALAALCVLDPNVKRVRGQLNATSKQLRDAGYTVADLDKYNAWWKSHDWRGQRGDKPILSLIPTQILQAVQWVPQPAWVPPVQAAKPRGYDLSTLRSWHKQHYYEQWNYRVAAELGISPTMPGAFKEWYDSEASIPDDQLTAWYERHLAASEENHQW